MYVLSSKFHINLLVAFIIYIQNCSTTKEVKILIQKLQVLRMGLAPLFEKSSYTCSVIQYCWGKDSSGHCPGSQNYFRTFWEKFRTMIEINNSFSCRCQTLSWLGQNFQDIFQKSRRMAYGWQEKEHCLYSISALRGQ